MRELKWGVMVAGVYWKAGQYRIERGKSQRFVAVKFTPDWRDSKRLGDYATLQEAKDACEQEAGA